MKWNRNIARGLGIFLALIAGLGEARGEEARPVLAGYLPDYAAAGFPTAGADHLTDLIYFGLGAEPDGRVPEKLLPDELAGKIAEWKKPGRRVWACVGGWGKSKGFAAITADPAKRGRFVADLAALCEREKIDGIDYDWEHPEGFEQLEGYVLLVEETRRALEPAGRQVSVAQASWQDLGQRMYRAVHRVHLMSYDHDFPQATFEKSAADSEKLLAWGCPAAKLVLGVPFYGRDEKRAAKTWRELAVAHPQEAEKDRIAGFAVNSPATLRKKAAWAREKGLAGLMIWEITQDNAAGTLLQAAAGMRR